MVGGRNGTAIHGLTGKPLLYVLSCELGLRVQR
jgi:hypothetical protein